MIFNGVDLSPYIKIKSIKGRGLLKQQVEFDERTYGHGAIIRRTRIPSVKLEVEFNIILPSINDIRDRLDLINSLIYTKNVVPIVFPDEPNFTYYGIPELSTGDELDSPFLHKGILTIFCPEPYKIGEEKVLNIGTTYKQFAITGIVETDWTSETTFTSSASSYFLENDKGGFINLKYDFISGDVLKIDYKYRKVYVNDELKQVIVQFNTNWTDFILKPGQMQIKASHNTTIKYKEKYPI